MDKIDLVSVKEIDYIFILSIPAKETNYVKEAHKLGENEWNPNDLGE